MDDPEGIILHAALLSHAATDVEGTETAGAEARGGSGPATMRRGLADGLPDDGGLRHGSGVFPRFGALGF